ncbi:MAG: hypothetical protein KF898_10000 [Parachlamydiales bacterium]|nr:hypothetical protein [Candidatus Acheromyda pituitae]
MKLFRNLILASLACCATALAANPNPPVWPANVYVFTQLMSPVIIQSTIDGVFATNGGQVPPDNGQFVNQGYAFLFAPGTYTSTNSSEGYRIGYYTSIMGLGENPGDTIINSVSCPQGNPDYMVGALNTFWRSAENFKTTTPGVWVPTTAVGMTWAASQASPLRKIHLDGTLYLFQLALPGFQGGFSSGGFMADCKISGDLMNQSAVVSGSQQQWITRNTDMTVPSGSVCSGVSPCPNWSNGVWSQVFVGCNGAPASHCSNCPTGTPPCGCLNCTDPSCTATCTGNPYTTVAATPIIAEKPYITTDAGAGSYKLKIPQIETNKIGTSEDNSTPVVSVDFTQVYVARASSDTAATINQQIEAGYHVILTPGTYNLTDPIQINKPDIVVLGIGFPIIISSTGKPCIVVGSVSGVRVGGVLLQAGPSTNPVTPTLLQWGPVGGDQSITSGFLYDCFCRTGRFSGNPNEPFNQTELMVQINSDKIVCDNLWLWRADHDSQGLVYNEDNYCNTAMQVNGNNVTAYGLACEHTVQDICQWNGNNGSCYFFQAEFPYDVTESYGTSGYVGYRVGNAVSNHLSFAAGVYSFFRDHNVFVKSGICAPAGPGIQFTNAFTRYLNGNGGIGSVLNGNLGMNQNCNTPQSPSVTVECPGPAYLCDGTDQQCQPPTRGRRRY